MPTSIRRAARALASFTRLDRLFNLRAQYSRAPRTRLEVTALEERVVPDGTQVSLEWLADGGEPGTAAELRVTRATDQNTIDTTALSVSLLFDGSASRGTDYAFPCDWPIPPGGISGANNVLSVTIPQGQSSYTLSVPVLDDTAGEGWESITALVQSSPNYTVGSADPVTLWIEDDDLWLEADADPVLTGQEVTFWLPDDAPEFASVEWDANYNGTTFTPVSGASDTWFAATFTTAGARTVAARVTDANNNAQIVTLSVTVEVPPPVVTVPDTLTATVGTPVTFDADPVVGATITSVEWALAYETDEGWEYEELTDLTELEEEYTFDDPGEYWVRVTVTDANGKSGEGWIAVTVDGAAPTASVAVSGPTDEGQPVTFTLTNFDPALLADVTIWVNWTGAENEAGDGIFQALTPADLTVHPNGSVTFTHVYNAPGADTTYDAVVWLEDDWGEGSQYPVTVTVKDVRPLVNLVAENRRGVIATDAIVNGVTVTTTHLDLRAVTPGTPLQLANVRVAATENPNQVTYHWEIDGTEAPNTNVPALVPPDMWPGRTYQVRAWVTDGGGTDSVVQAFTLAVDGSGNAPSGGAVRTGGLIHGTLSVKQDGTVERYGRFNELPRFGRIDWDATPQPITMETNLEPSTLAYAAALGATVQYRYLVSVYDVEEFTWPIPDNYDLLWAGTITPPNGGRELPLDWGPLGEAAMWVFHTDREINITPVVSFVMPNGTVTNTTSLAAFKLLTLKTQTTGGQLADAFASIRTLTSQLADKGTIFLNAVTDNPDKVFRVLMGGFMDGVKDFAAAMVNGGLREQLYTWMTGGAANLTAALNGVNFNDPNTLKNFVLQYAGLTPENVQNVVRQQLGAGNLLALDTVLAWFKDSSGNAVTDANVLLGNIRTGIAQALPGESGLDINPDTLFATASAALEAKLKDAGIKLAAQFAAKFVPGAGAIVGVYNIAKWVIDNQAQLVGLFAQFVQAIDALTLSNETQARAQVALKVSTGLGSAVQLLLGGMAGQFGLGNLPQQLRKAVDAVPAQVNGVLAVAVAKVAVAVAAAVPGGRTGLPDNLVAMKRFNYPEETGPEYLLFAYQEGALVKVEVAEKLAAGGWRRFAGRPLDSQAFTTFKLKPEHGGDGFNAKAHMTAFGQAAKALSDVTKARPAPGTTAAAANTALANARAAYLTAETRLVKDIQKEACVALQAGCFAAGTKLLTKRGWLAVEALVEGDEVAARHESEPGGAVEWKPVEACFRRTGRILHLHFANGELIRTTPEHPFHVEGKGWTAAGALKAGDRLVTLIGDSVGVAEVFDTELWDSVYNVRVADFHTYFVGDESWGFSVWAHNAYDLEYIKQTLTAKFAAQNLQTEQVARFVNQIVTGISTQQNAAKYKTLVFESLQDVLADNGTHLLMEMTGFKKWLIEKMIPNLNADAQGYFIQLRFAAELVKTAQSVVAIERIQKSGLVAKADIVVDTTHTGYAYKLMTSTHQKNVIDHIKKGAIQLNGEKGETLPDDWNRIIRVDLAYHSAQTAANPFAQASTKEQVIQLLLANGLTRQDLLPKSSSTITNFAQIQLVNSHGSFTITVEDLPLAT